MLSRMAESLYWMSRYLERAGNTARLLEINLIYLLEAEDAIPEAAQWRPLLGISGSEEAFRQCYDGSEITAARVIQYMTQERKNTNAIRSSLRLARENARVVRDRISKEMWEAMNQLWLGIDRKLGQPLSSDRAGALYAEVRNGVARFHGLTIGTMFRGEAFAFYILGTFLERADMTARLLDVKYHLLLPDASMVGSPLDYYQWGALLKSISGFEEFRRRYKGGLRPIDIADFIIFEPDFPRSIRFAIDRMRQALDDIRDKGTAEATERALTALEATLGRSTPATVFAEGLHQFLETLLGQIADLNAALATDFFETYAATSALPH